MAEKIGAEALCNAVSGWSVADGEREAVRKVYKFADFKSAFAFMTQVAMNLRRHRDADDGHVEDDEQRARPGLGALRLEEVWARGG